MDIKRIQYWDIAKGIAIILMVLGHISTQPLILRDFIFSFHMPLFFVANAFFIKKYDIEKTFYKSVKSLLVPYFVIALIAAFIYGFQHIGQGALDSFGLKLAAMLFSSTRPPQFAPAIPGIWVIWFVTCLFVARNSYVIIRKIGEKTHISVAIALSVFLFIVGYHIGVKGTFMPWSFDIAFACLGFMWLGDIVHRTKFFDLKVFWIIAIISGVIWIYLVTNGFFVELALKKYSTGPWGFIAAVLGCFVVIAVSKLLEKVKIISSFLIWAGKNSMIILGYHNIEMMYFNWTYEIPAIISDEYMWIIRFLLRIVSTLLFTYVFCKIKFIIIKSIDNRRKQLTL